MKLYQHLHLSALLILGCLSCVAHATEPTSTSLQLYSGDPDFTKLSANLADNRSFEPAPKPSVQELILYSHNVASGEFYSRYQILPLKTQGTRTYYQTNESVENAAGFDASIHGSAVVHGQGISYGGIFWPLEEMKITDTNGKNLYFNKIAIISIEPISGHLFPLAVGNQLKFKFTRLHERMFRGEHFSTIEHGIMEYEVIKKQNGYPLLNHSVPGDIYTLNVLETTDLHPKQYFTDQYDYSPKLGWYINDRYYNQNNKMIASYKLEQWKQNT